MPKTMTFAILEPRTMVLVHGRENPGDEEWAVYLDAVSAAMVHHPDLVALAVTDGGGPNSVQRADLNERLRASRESRGAVVTESRVARGIVTALSWFNWGIKAFPPARLPEALRYLGLPDDRHAEAVALVQQLRADLDLVPFREVGAV